MNFSGETNYHCFSIASLLTGDTFLQKQIIAPLKAIFILSEYIPFEEGIIAAH